MKNLSKRFGKLSALEHISFEAPGNSIAGVIGPNGAGKTTLLLSLAGLLPADSGRVEWESQAVAANSRSQTFFCVEDAIRPQGALFVETVLNFYAAAFKRTEVDRDNIVDRLALRGFLLSQVRELSKGTAKRFLIGVGLLSTQPVLMLDEPFDGLDLRQTLDLVPVLRQCSAAGRTLVLSIHQLRDAERVCDRFVLLNNGKLAGQGTLAELRALADCPEGATLEEIFLALT